MTHETMLDARWEERTRVLNRSGYARYDESTSTMLADTSDLLICQYDGDLRRLRDESEHDADAERRALQQFSGIGPTDAAIFSREVQLVWEEMYPFADQRALEAAEQLGLGKNVSDLERNSSGPEELTALVAALVRCGLADDHNEVLEAARR